MSVAMPVEIDPEMPVVEAIRRGDRLAFDDFLRRQGRWVRGVIFGILGDRDRVDDAAQQVWLSVWSRIAELRDVERWRPWLYRLARNAALDAGRSTTRQREAVKELAEAPPPRPRMSAPAEEVAGAEERGLVLDAIKALPALYREPFVMRHLESWSYREISDVLGLPVETVETRLVRARRLLRELLEGKI